METSAPPASTSWKEGLLRHWVPLALVACVVGSPLAYFAFAKVLALVAFFLSTVLMLAAFAFLIAIVWPMGEHITWSRRLEVFGYRALLGAGAYLMAGYLLILLLNLVSPRTIPIGWPDNLLRRLPFWPFYTWFVTGCEWMGVCPPPP